MINRQKAHQRIKYLQSLDDRSPEEEAILAKLLTQVSKPVSSAEMYSIKKVRQYYAKKTYKQKQTQF